MVGGNNILRMPAGTSSSTFGGGSLEVAQGTVGLMKNTGGSVATVPGQFTLNGGTLIYGPDGSSTSNHVAVLAIQRC